MSFLELATQLAERNVPAIRLRPRTKIAQDSNWPALATTDVALLEKWNCETPDANCAAVAKAELNGVWFFEIDSPAVLERIETETGKKIPLTYRVRSRPGRGHYYWKQNAESIALGNVAQGYVKHGDFSVRVNSEYVVAAGSIHPISGEPYEVVCDAPIIECPAWLIDWINAQQIEKKKVNTAEAGPIPDGMRNDVLASIAGSLRHVGLSQEDIETQLLKINAERCVPPYPEDGVRIIAGSIARYDAGDPAKEIVYIGGVPAGTATPRTSGAQAAAAGVDVSTWGDHFKAVQELEEGEVRMLINGFMPEGVTFIGALPGEGKTLLGLSIAKALTTGKDFLGRADFSVPTVFPVLYMIPESGGRAFRKRCERFHIPNDRNVFICRTVSEGATIGLTDPILLEAVRRLKPVVILDTLIRFSESKDENSSMENKQLTEGITGLRQAGAIGIIALHHSNKSTRKDGMSLENVLRGTGDIAAFPDAVYGMLRDSSLYDHGNGPNEIDVECVKPRDFNPPLPFRIAASCKTGEKTIGAAPGILSYIDSVGDFVPVHTAAIQTNRDAELLRRVEGDPSMTLKELSEATGMSTWLARQALKRLGWAKQKGGLKGVQQWTKKAQSEFTNAGETAKSGSNADVVLQ